MRKKLILFMLLGIGSLLFQNVALATESQSVEAYRVWQHQPLSINLPVGKPRTLQFPNAVQFGVPPTLASQLSVNNNAGELQLTALKPFINQRVEVKDNTTGNQILLDLSAGLGRSDLTLAILYKKPNNDYSDSSGWLKEPYTLRGEMAFVTLTRFAEQQLYSPKRLLKNPYNVHLINSYIDRRGHVPKNDWFYGLFLDNSTVNIPWAEWFGGQEYVTAVLVRNQLSTPIDLTRNIANICGRESGIWKSVTFFPAWHLSSAGNLHDTAVAFLVSDVPFDQAVKACEDE